MSSKSASETAKKRRSPLWAKLLLGVGVVVLVAASGGAVYAKSLMARVDNAGDHRDLLGNGDATAGEDVKGPLNMLMIGTDLRVDDPDGMDRADSIMMLHINKDLTQANIISFPRDLKVPIDDCGNGASCEDKINSSYEAGGDTPEKRFQNLAKTLSSFTNIDSFDGAAIVGFEGFLDAVKTMGSIELCLPMDMQLDHQMREQNKPRTFKKGCHEYNQREALWIVRERHAYYPETPGFDPDYGLGDYGRQHMQQHFIKQLLKKASEDGYITDTSKVGDLIDSVGSSLTLDLNGHKTTDFAFALRHIKPDKLQTVRLPSETEKQTPPNGGEPIDYEVIPEGEADQASKDLFKAVQDDTIDEWINKHPDLVNKD